MIIVLYLIITLSLEQIINEAIEVINPFSFLHTRARECYTTLVSAEIETKNHWFRTSVSLDFKLPTPQNVVAVLVFASLCVNRTV